MTWSGLISMHPLIYIGYAVIRYRRYNGYKWFCDRVIHGWVLADKCINVIQNIKNHKCHAGCNRWLLLNSVEIMKYIAFVCLVYKNIGIKFIPPTHQHVLSMTIPCWKCQSGRVSSWMGGRLGTPCILGFLSYFS